MAKALLLIDIQNIYFTEGPYLLAQPEKAAGVAAEILKEFREQQLPVIHVKHAFKTDGYPVDGQYLNEIHESVYPQKGEVIIQKTCPSSFYQTDLDEQITRLGIDEFVVCGMMSHMCIDTTVRACKDRNLKVTVYEDACTTKDLIFKGKVIPAKVVHESFMAGIDKMFAKVVSYH